MESEESIQDAIWEVATHSVQEPPSSLEEEVSAVVGKAGTWRVFWELEGHPGADTEPGECPWEEQGRAERKQGA